MSDIKKSGQGKDKQGRDSNKKRKPEFHRQNYKKLARLDTKWRKPRGHQSKLRKSKKGHAKRPRIGYKSPKVLIGLIDGLKPRRVFNLDDLKDTDPKKEIIIIASGVGLKKRQTIVERAKELGIRVRNLRRIKRKLIIRKKKTEKEAKKESEKEVKEKDAKEKTSDKKSERS